MGLAAGGGPLAGRLTDETGRYLGSILLFKDLREIRTLRNEIARNQRLATVGRLAAGVAHEIRNPLSSIKGFATYFKERFHENPPDAQTAAIMIQEVDRLNRRDAQGRRKVRIHGIGFPTLFSQSQFPEQTGIRFSMLIRLLCERNGGAFVALNSTDP